MDKNAIKKFATWARIELIARVSQKAEHLGVTQKNPGNPMDQSVHGHLLSVREQSQRAALIARVTAKGWQHTMEEVAYTWFNRFCALRYMEVNGYLPSHIRVFTDEEGAFKPQILTEAIHLELKGLDRDKVYQFKDKNQTEALYKYLLITQCNALSKVLPRMFQRIEDDTELLLPDNLLREGSVIEQMISLVPEDDWTDQVQIIGWLYQYYNAEPKDKVFANLKKNIKISKHDIPAATQLFTPDWIVRYMVENSLGRIWLERKRALDETIDEKAAAEGFGWKYYLPEAEQEPQVQAEIKKQRQSRKDLKPADIMCIDPCMGSGHILVYMFDVLMQICRDYGYSDREAVRSILEQNLYGLDIDDRAAQLAYFAVMMKARQYDRRLLTRTLFDGKPDIPQPQVYPIMESNSLNLDMVAYFVGKDAGLRENMDTLMHELKDAKEYGSILTISPVDFNALYARFDEVVDEVHFQRDAVLHTLLPFVRQAQALAQQYEVVVTNPPYMGSSNMSKPLLDFVKTKYPVTKADMSTVFMERTPHMLCANGYLAMINIPVWMSLSSYVELRKLLIKKHIFQNMVHPGRGVFGSDFGTTSFVIAKTAIRSYRGCYYRLFDQQGEVSSVDELEQRFLEKSDEFIACQDNYSKIPGSPIAYWASNELINNYQKGIRLDSVAQTKQGIKTADNERFLRLWHEVIFPDTSILSGGNQKWFPCNKGGSFRKWYGNNEYVINWEDNGREIKEYRDDNGRQKSRPQNLQYMLREGLTYTNISISSFGVRYCPEGFIYDAAGSGIFCNDSEMLYYVLAFLTSKVAALITTIASPTMSFEVGQVSTLPLLIESRPDASELVKESIRISQYDWDMFESSWDFKNHPLVIYGVSLHSKPVEGNMLESTPDVQIGILKNNEGIMYYEKGLSKAYTLHSAYEMWKEACDNRFNQLKANEEALNRIFIDIYGLQEELTPEVEEKDVTVYRIIDEPNAKQRKMRYVLSRRDAMVSLISYAVGCMFGRYSLDVEGLAYAGGEWDDSKYSTYLPDRDGILPITDEEYFTDDILTRFVNWVRAAYGADSQEENLRFVAEALGGSGTPREVIRNYFLKDFYKDHLKTYQKRPIYWLFDSGKENGFKALIYLHRYRPDTIARLRTDNVHELQSRYRTAVGSLENRIASAATTERVRLNKQLAKVTAQAEELRLYEEKIHHLADQMIAIDLDDGVKHNYAIFQDVLAKI